MEYLITFLEGVISFISPCMLPMLPLYISYFAGGAASGPGSGKKVFFRALAFVIGFTVVFALLGLLSGSLGMLLVRYKTIVNIVCGAFVVFFGICYLGIIPLGFLKGIREGRRADSIASAFIFGIIYSVSLTPCIGAFLGSALMMAGTAGTALKGVMLLIFYSIGLGLPFLISAVLLGKLKTAFDFIKRHYNVINIVCGCLLIVLGILMMCGLMNRILGALI